MTPEQIATDILSHIVDASEIDHGMATALSFGNAKSLIATALRQSRNEALEEAASHLFDKIANRTGIFENIAYACINEIRALKHKDGQP